MPIPAVDLTPGDTYLHGTTRLTVTDWPTTTRGCLGGDVLRIPVRDTHGVESCDVVHTDHQVQKET